MVGEGSPISAPSGVNTLQSFSDATAGRSIQLFYACGTNDSVTQDYVLSRDGGTSYPVKHQTSGGIDFDFDITINKPTIFAGIVTIDVHFGRTSHTGGSGGPFVFYIRKYDGSTETDLVTITSKTFTSGETFQTKMQGTLARTKFSVGDILRFTVYAPGTVNGENYLNFDPLTAGNELKLWMPVVNLE